MTALPPISLGFSVELAGGRHGHSHLLDEVPVLRVSEDVNQLDDVIMPGDDVVDFNLHLHLLLSAHRANRALIHWQ